MLNDLIEFVRSNDGINDKAALATLVNNRYDCVKDWVAVYPEKMVRVADWKKRLIVEVGISHPVINIWDREDKNGYRQIKLWKCQVLRMFKPAGDDTEHIYYEADETINEKLPDYIKDLIESDMVVR